MVAQLEGGIKNARRRNKAKNVYTSVAWATQQLEDIAAIENSEDSSERQGYLEEYYQHHSFISLLTVLTFYHLNWRIVIHYNCML
jgi:hypothetical protein